MPECVYQEVGQPKCNRDASPGKNLCREHVIELWWTWVESPATRARFHQPNNNVVGFSAPLARRDLRNVNAGHWTFVVASNIKDRFFEVKSAPFAVEKMGRKALNYVGLTVSNSQTDFYCSRPNVNGGQGHSYFRLRNTGIDECFGFITGLTAEDPYGSPQVMAKSNQLYIDYAVTSDQKNAICGVISEWIFYGYDLNARNCTEFVKAACTAANIWWPAHGLPVMSNQTGSLGKVQTPNNLYLALQLSQYAYDPLLEGAHTHAPQTAMAIYVSQTTLLSVAVGGLAVAVQYGINHLL